MAKKKSKLDVGKGFKRIFYVIATIWFVFLMVLTAAERSECIGDPATTPFPCDDYTDAEAFMYSLLLWTGTSFAAYFFFK
jgi:hypothetical protein